MDYKFQNRTDANGNVHVRITVNDINIIDVTCTNYRVQMITRPVQNLYQIRGTEFNNIFEFVFDEVSLPVAIDEQDLLDQLTDIFNCCKCTT